MLSCARVGTSRVCPRSLLKRRSGLPALRSRCGGGLPDGLDVRKFRTAELASLGFPLDQTLQGLTNWSLLTIAVPISEIVEVDLRWNTSDGKPPAFISEGRAPSEAKGAFAATVVTQSEGTVVESLVGECQVGERVTIFIRCGSFGETFVVSGDGVEPDCDDLFLSELLLLGGIGLTFDNVVGIELTHAYLIDDGGAASSLLESASDKTPGFTIDEARDAFAGWR